MMKKFTFISEYKGGTYISQYEEINIEKALILWSENLDPLFYLSNDILQIKKEVLDTNYAPTPLKGIESVWCCSYLFKKSLLLLNIIETV